MKSRRFVRSPRPEAAGSMKRGGALYFEVAGDCCAAGFPSGLCPLGVNRYGSTRRRRQCNVRFTPNSDQIDASQRNVALCQEQTYAAQQTQSALAPWICQLSGTLPALPDCRTCKPLSSQIATAPLLKSRQRMSLLPSPLKSPVPTMPQLVATVPAIVQPARTPGVPLCRMDKPFISQIATVPVGV